MISQNQWQLFTLQNLDTKKQTKMNHIILKQVPPKLKDAIIKESETLCISIKEQQIEVNKAIKELNKRNELYANFCKKYNLTLACDIEHQTVIDSICELFETSQDKVFAKTRKREIVALRQSITYVLWYMFGAKTSLKKIGSWVGGKDHSTIIHTKEVVNNALSNTDSNPTLYDIYMKISEYLKVNFYVVLPC